MSFRHSIEASSKLTNKRLRDSEEELFTPAESPPLAKRAKRAKTVVPDTQPALTAETLERHTHSEGYLDTLELMGSEADKRPRNGWSKRSASRVGLRDGSVASTSRDLETTSQVTQKSSFTAAHYRHFILEAANIRFQFRLPPEDIRTQITTIVQPKVSPVREEELLIIGRKFYDDFADGLDNAAREDCVELFYQVLSSLGYNENLALPRKADWLPCLKPCAPPTTFKLDHLYGSVDKAKESSEPLKKRHQADKAFPSPDTSKAAYTVERIESLSSLPLEVKTPRPDISIGLRDDALVNALQLRGLPGAKPKRFIEALAKPHPQKNTVLLHSQPTCSELQTRFPCLLVEGKSYATNRTIYEAQNQAAVSGACSLKILHDLDDLVHKSDPGSYSKRQPIVFSVCTEGPIHQLWVHYTTVEDGDGDSEGDRVYYMAQIKTYDVGIWDDVSGFLQAVDNVMRWASGNHKNAIAEQLEKVARAAS